MTKEEKINRLIEFIDSELNEKKDNELWSVLHVIKVSLENL